MGLDQYFYAQKGNGEKEEIGYLRKHNWIHGWMENLWEKQGKPLPEGRESTDDPWNMSSFNCIPVRLYLKDIRSLRNAIKKNKLKPVEGLFFGGGEPDDWSKEEELRILENAEAWIADGYKIFYDSWW